MMVRKTSDFFDTFRSSWLQ